MLTNNYKALLKAMRTKQSARTRLYNWIIKHCKDLPITTPATRVEDLAINVIKGYLKQRERIRRFVKTELSVVIAEINGKKAIRAIGVEGVLMHNEKMKNDNKK